MEDTLARGRQALGTLLEVPPGDPFAAAWVRGCSRHGLPSDFQALLATWEAFHPGSMAGEMRYRWPLSHRRIPAPEFAGAPAAWRPWRASDRLLDADPRDFEERLSLPVALCEAGELLCEVAGGDAPGDAAVAGRLLAEAEPALRRDFSAFIQTRHAWADTFALWCLVRRPLLLGRLQPFALAVATCYAALVSREDGCLAGLRFPYHRVPLASASAHLACALLALGQEPSLAAALTAWVASRQRSSGGWGDGADPEDLLTTLAAADLLAHTDPGLAPGPVADFFAARQTPGAYWAAYGPEAPWLTAEVLDLLAALELPFAQRFRWPHLPDAARDRKTALPSYGWFAQLAELLGALPGLARAPVDLAFIDLAGFRAFNNRFGQDRGDEALGLFARELRALPRASALRDGGDEFLVLGSPTGVGLAEELDGLRRSWPRRFAERFGHGVPPVAPRILVAEARGRGLVSAREELGREISALKGRAPHPGAEGVLEHLGRVER